MATKSKQDLFNEGWLDGNEAFEAKKYKVCSTALSKEKNDSATWQAGFYYGFYFDVEKIPKKDKTTHQKALEMKSKLNLY